MGKTFSAVMQKLLVYQNNNRVGYGYVIIRGDGRMSAPTLLSDDGKILPQGEWYNLVMTSEQHLVVINGTKQ